MRNIKCPIGIIVKSQDQVTLVFDLNSDETYSLEGDAGKLLALIYRLGRIKAILNLAELKSALLKESSTFSHSLHQDESLCEALSYLAGIRLIELQQD